MFGDEAQSQSVLPIITSIRPKRVAFLVDSDTTTCEEIDELIRFNSRVWGGRYNPIIPTLKGELDADWWKFLVACDPDLIFSFHELSDELLNRINRYILPSQIIEISAKQREQRAPRPIGVDEFTVRAITTHGIPRYVWAQRGGVWGDPHFFLLTDQHDLTDMGRFALRNFGLLRKDMTTATMFREVPHTEVNPQIVGMKYFFEGEFIPGQHRPVFPIDLAGMFAARRFSLAYEHRVPGFHLVIGNSPWELLYLWNLAFQERPRAGREALWLPEEALANEELLVAVAKWIGKSFWGDQGDRRGAVVSSTVSKERLDAAAKVINPLAHVFLVPHELPKRYHPFPNSFNRVEPGHDHASFFTENRFSTTDQVPLSDDGGLVRLIKPEFHNRAETQFGWMVDLSIGYRPERYFYTNVRPIWRLPKRLGVPRLFVPQGGPRGRITWNGLPSYEIEGSSESLNLQIPEDRGVIWTCCFDTYATNSRREDRPKPKRFDDIATSDKGRHVRGMLQLFGSIFHAGHFFEDPYWRSIAYILAGRPDPEAFRDKRVELTLNVIKTWFAERGTDFKPDEANLRALSEAVADKLTFRDAKSITLTLDALQGKFAQMRRDALEANPESGYWTAHKKFDAIRRHDLIGHLRDKIIMQGIELRCPHCYTTAWHGVGELEATVQCKGCLSTFPFDLDPDWSFRLNDLLGNAIRYHGTISVIHALYHIDQFRDSHGMTAFLPCQDLFLRDEKRRNDDNDVSIRDGGLHFAHGERYSDLDLMLISQGRMIIGEVKSDPEGFKADDFRKLAAIAKELLPDELVLAAVGEQWDNATGEQIGKLSAELGPLGVVVSPLLLRWSRD